MKFEMRNVHDDSLNELSGISKLIESINQVPYHDILDGFKVEYGHKEGISGYRSNYGITDHLVSLNENTICFKYTHVGQSENGDAGSFIIKGSDLLWYNISLIFWVDIGDIGTYLNTEGDSLSVMRRILGDKIIDIGLISKWDELIYQIKDKLDKRLRDIRIVATYPEEDGLKAISNICRDLLSEEGKTYIKEHDVRGDVASLMCSYIEIK